MNRNQLTYTLKVNQKLVILSTFLFISLVNINYIDAQDDNVTDILLNHIKDLENKFEKYFGLANPFLIFGSTGMQPVINQGDLLIISNHTKFSDLSIGDIIAFYRPDGKDPIIVHRIIDITDKFGEKIIVTKGDARENIIPGVDFPIREKEYIGKVVHIQSSKY